MLPPSFAATASARALDGVPTMSRAKSHFSIMFADIAGSTEIYERLGDERARVEIGERLRRVGDTIAEYSGTLIKTIGDEVLCTFREPEDAVRAAAAMHRGIELKAPANGSDLYTSGAMRIGLHRGPVIYDRGDIFGRAVNLAARIVSLAKAQQTLATRRIVDHLPATQRSSTRLIDRLGVKGRRGPVEVFELIWKEEDMTTLVGESVPQGVVDPEDHPYLLLSYQGREIHVDGRQPFLILGRSPSCDLVIDDKMVSRLHLRIEMRRGKFYLVDHSSNGTYLVSGDGEEQVLRREETALPERGRLSPGRSFSERPAVVVHFEAPRVL